jgi:3-phenylpropionate/trans-cinnamate dioxygenase ferredoxin reductase subunit
VPSEIVIVGASVAGVGVAGELRRLGYDGRLVLLSDEPHLPYDRPPLSKGLLTGEITPERILLRPESYYAEHDITLLTGTSATRLDAAGRRLELATGEVLTPDSVVIATGARARPLDAASRETLVTLRGLDDALRLRQGLQAGPRLVIVGGGFIGGEVAASARKLGLDVTMVEAAPLPLAGLVGDDVASALLRTHVDAGVHVHRGTAVERVERARGAEHVILTDGRVIEGDLVVAGLGSLPNTEWLHGAGVDISGGVRCDGAGTTSIPDVYATGDVASQYDEEQGRHVRQEHWTSAREQARITAAHILGRTAPRPAGTDVPYFWSDQYGKRIQSLGRPGDADEMHVVHGSLDEDSFVTVYGRAGRLIGAVGYNAAARLMRLRAAIGTGALPLQESLS